MAHSARCIERLAFAISRTYLMILELALNAKDNHGRVYGLQT